MVHKIILSRASILDKAEKKKKDISGWITSAEVDDHNNVIITMKSRDGKKGRTVTKI